MRTIYKYPLIIKSSQFVDMPSGAEILSAQMQRGVLMIWALVDTEASAEAREFLIFGTGHRIPDSIGRHLVTAQDTSDYVWHVFEPGVAP